MKMTGNTVLLTGAVRGSAGAFHDAGKAVIIADRRPAPLAEVVAAHPRMTSVVLDLADPEAIQAFAGRATRDYPALNVLINNAGIMQTEDAPQIRSIYSHARQRSRPTCSARSGSRPPCCRTCAGSQRPRL